MRTEPLKTAPSSLIRHAAPIGVLAQNLDQFETQSDAMTRIKAINRANAKMLLKKQIEQRGSQNNQPRASIRHAAIANGDSVTPIIVARYL
jgi:hypothetical protein